MPRIKNYINGEFVKPFTEEYMDVEDPGNGEKIGEVPVSTEKDVNLAVSSAKKASYDWASMPINRRIKFLYKLKDAVERRREDLVLLLVQNGGKTLSDANAEIDRSVQNIMAAVNIEAYMGKDVESTVHTSTRIRPVGVHASINPYNFPLMVPFWSLPYAIASGNTSIVKVSPQVPLPFDCIASIFSEIGLPQGVVNVIHGDGKTANYLTTHPDIDAITFVGSTNIGQKVYKTATSKFKRVQTLCSAKNVALVTGGGINKDEENAFLNKVSNGIVSSAYGAAGQRCAAISNLLIIDNLYERLLEKLTQAATQIKVGYSTDEGVYMGPVISQAHLKRLHAFIEKALEEKANLHLDGRDVKIDSNYHNGHYIGPTILTNVNSEMSIFHTEAFGPILNVGRINSFEEGVKAINKIKYGNIATLYSLRIDEKDYFLKNVNVGMTGINVPIPAAWAPFSFGGKPGTESLYGGASQGSEVIRFLTYPMLVIENPNILSKSAKKFHQK